MRYVLLFFLLCLTTLTQAIDITFDNNNIYPNKGQISLPLVLKNTNNTVYICRVYATPRQYDLYGNEQLSTKNVTDFQILPQNIIIPPNGTEYVTISYITDGAPVEKEKNYRLFIEDIVIKPLKEVGIKTIEGQLNIVYQKAYAITVHPNEKKEALTATHIKGVQWKLKNTGTTRVNLSNCTLTHPISQKATPLTLSKNSYKWLFPNEERLVSANEFIQDKQAIEVTITHDNHKKKNR